MQPTKCPSISPLIGIKPDAVTVLVDQGVEIDGTIRNKSMRAIMIAGVVRGSVESNGPVIITAGGIITGSLKATSVQLAGTLDRGGDTDKAEILGPFILEKTAHLGCDAFAAGYEVQYGATIDGSMRPRKPSTEEEAAVSDAIKANNVVTPVTPLRPVEAAVSAQMVKQPDSQGTLVKPSLGAAVEQFTSRMGAGMSGS
jgi:cytoskeletal protein CcmA (bactofilin family)